MWALTVPFVLFIGLVLAQSADPLGVITSDFNTAQIVPNVISTFSPTDLVNVSYTDPTTLDMFDVDAGMTLTQDRAYGKEVQICWILTNRLFDRNCHAPDAYTGHEYKWVNNGYSRFFRCCHCWPRCPYATNSDDGVPILTIPGRWLHDGSSNGNSNQQ